MSNIPFILSLDAPPFYGHDIFPNSMYRRMHARQHDPLDLHTLGQIARLGPHAHHLAARHHGELATPLSGNGQETKGFEVHLDVGLFQPGELSVKAVNGFVVVEGKHEEREDEHGHISRHFVRRYKLPKDYDDVDAIVSTLSADGVLTVRVPDPQLKDKANERIIQIQQTGPSDLFLKNNGNSHGKENDKEKEKAAEK